MTDSQCVALYAFAAEFDDTAEALVEELERRDVSCWVASETQVQVLMADHVEDVRPGDRVLMLGWTAVGVYSPEDWQRFLTEWECDA